MKINQFYADCRSAKMEARDFLILIFFNVLVTNAYGLDFKRGRQTLSFTPEDCMRPPTSKHDRHCCRPPKERIWGDLRQSLDLCLRRMKLESKPTRSDMAYGESEMMTPEGSDVITSTEIPGELASIPSTSPSTYSTTSGHFDRHGRPYMKKPYHLHRRSNDSCFMECVFEDQGFLLNKVVNKEALLGRLSETLKENEPWRKVATAAVEICYQTEMSTPSNETCRSGSEKVFRCIFKHIFFNCPNWAQSEYCMTLKEFYQKCPNGPPPEINDNHSTKPPSLEDDMESNPSTESEKQTEPE